MKYIFPAIVIYVISAGCGNSANDKSEYLNNNESIHSEYIIDEDEEAYKYESRSGVRW